MIAIEYQFVPYLWFSFFLSLLIISLIFFAFKNRVVIGAGHFLKTLILVEMWVAAQAMEMTALDLQTKLFWANLQYIPALLTPATFLCLTSQFTGRDKCMGRGKLFLIPPAAMTILAFTNDSHGLIRQNVYLNVSGLWPTVSKTFGPMFWVFAAYNYILCAASIVFLVNAYREKFSIYRKQILFLLLSLVFPVISNVHHLLGRSPLNIDTTPMMFGFSAVIIYWGIFRYRLFDVVPVARSFIIQEMKTGMLVFESDGRILDVNPAALKMLGISDDHVIGKTVETELGHIPDLVRVCREGKETSYELVVEHNDTNSCYEVSLMRIKIARQEFVGWLMQIYNITERKIAEEIIQYAAYHDALTGLPNRNYFQVLFSQELAHARLRGDELTVAFLDLDNFKNINDTCGHDAGDRVLCEVSKRLKEILRESDIISRIGGDEFAIVFSHVGEDEKVRLIGNKILGAFEQEFNLGNRSARIRASIGFSVFPRDGEIMDDLLHKADQAMYQVKGGIKNSYSIYRNRLAAPSDPP